MAKNGKKKQRSDARQNRPRTELQNGNRRSYLVRAVVTVGMLLVAISILALVQQPGLLRQARGGANLATDGTNSLLQSPSVAEKTDLTMQPSVSTDAQEAGAATIPVAPSVGALAPDFSLDDITGQTVSRAAFAGKPMFITFFHSW